MKELVTKAAVWAEAAHKSIDQRRKYSGDPYFVHPTRVAKTVADHTSDPVTIAAAYLHDVLEDVAPLNPEFNDDKLALEFGEEVYTVTKELTDEYTKENFPKLNRAARHALETERLARVSDRAQTVKLADILDNTADIMVADPGYAVMYIREKWKVVQILTRGEGQLRERVIVQLIKAKVALNIKGMD